MEKTQIFDKSYCKCLNSANYNYFFDKHDGMFIRTGKTEKTEDDPKFCPFGPEILDIEITTSCNGINGALCKACYKANTPNGKYMSFETFKAIFDKLPKIDGHFVATQIAFGVDSEFKTNPDARKIFAYSRENGVIPNVTVANIDNETAKYLAGMCGAVSVSRYEDKNVCYDSVKRLTDNGLKQVNIHQLVSEATFWQAIEVIHDCKTDKRLEGLRAIVFLALKQKGRGRVMKPLSEEKYKILVDACLKSGINFGFDSCSAFKFTRATDNPKKYESVIEPCESYCFSMYIDAEGFTYPCSFLEGEGDWKTGINLLNINDFLKDVWFCDRVTEARNKIIKARQESKDCFFFNI
jgi:hypothetical protein